MAASPPSSSYKRSPLSQPSPFGSVTNIMDVNRGERDDDEASHYKLPVGETRARHFAELLPPKSTERGRETTLAPFPEDGWARPKKLLEGKKKGNCPAAL